MPDTVTVKFIIEVAVQPDFLEWIAKDKYIKRTLIRALQENNVLRASEIVSKVSVEENRKQDEEDAYDRILFEDFP